METPSQPLLSGSFHAGADILKVIIQRAGDIATEGRLGVIIPLQWARKLKEGRVNDLPDHKQMNSGVGLTNQGQDLGGADYHAHAHDLAQGISAVLDKRLGKNLQTFTAAAV